MQKHFTPLYKQKFCAGLIGTCKGYVCLNVDNSGLVEWPSDVTAVQKAKTTLQATHSTHIPQILKTVHWIHTVLLLSAFKTGKP
jgi:hypothetical protein